MSDPIDQSCSHPLIVESFDQPNNDPDADDDDLDQDSDDDDSSKLKGGRGLNKPHIPIPKFRFGLGQTSIVWPPPKGLTAEDLKKKKKEHLSNKKSSSSSNHKLANHHTSKHTKQQNPSIPNHHPSKQQQNKSISHIIHVLHYSLGDPKPINRSLNAGLYMYREIKLLTTEKPQVLRDFAKEVVKWRIEKDHVEGDESKFALYRFKSDNCGGGWWQSEGMKRARPAKSVILPEGHLDNILQDVRNFLKPETKTWYIKHGLPHRRSYLFYGPPGTGKTSCIRAIGSSFRLNCCFLSMTTANFSNQMLGDALSAIPTNALIVLEDVDALFNEDRKNEQGASLTFSGLLNALDGLISADGVLTIMTTNHIERLDRALIRGGRVDRRFLFSKPTEMQLKDLFKSFYPDADKKVIQNFVAQVFARKEGDEARSIATLQQLFIDQRENGAEECVKSMPDFFERHFPSGTKTVSDILYM